MNLVSEIYSVTAQYPKDELYGLSFQTRRSAASVPGNIAEGAARNSRKEFLQHLHVALGSASELETQLWLARRMGVFAQDSHFDSLENVGKVLVALIPSLNRTPVNRHASRVT